MEPNEVMENEEVMETAAEEIVKAGSGCGFKMAAGFGLGILAGVAICKMLKPMMAKVKAQKETNDTVIDVEAEELQSDETEEKEPENPDK